MKAITVVRSALGLVWFGLIGHVVSCLVQEPTLPAELAKQVYANPYYSMSWGLFVIGTLLVMVASIGLWQCKHWSRVVFLCAVPFFLVKRFVLIPYMAFSAISFFDDAYLIFLGGLLALVFSAPYNQLFNGSFNLAKLKFLRWLALGCIVFTVLCTVFEDKSLFPAFYAYQKAYDASLGWIATARDIIGGFNGLLMIISFFLFFFRTRYTKYVFCLAVVIGWPVFTFLSATPVTSGVTVVLGDVFDFFLGMLMVLPWLITFPAQSTYSLPVVACLREGWQSVRGTKGVFLGAMGLIVGWKLLTMLFGYLGHVLLGEASIIVLLTMLGFKFIYLILVASLSNIALEVVYRRDYSLEDFFAVLKGKTLLNVSAYLIFVMLGAAIIFFVPGFLEGYFIAAFKTHGEALPRLLKDLLGVVFYIAAGLTAYLYTRVSMAKFYIFETKLNVFQAFKKSWQKTKGQCLKRMWLGILQSLPLIVTFLPFIVLKLIYPEVGTMSVLKLPAIAVFIVSLVWIIPFSALTSAVAFRKLDEQKT